MRKNILNYFSEVNFGENFNPENAVFEFFNTLKQTDGRGNFHFDKEKLERIADNFNSNILGQEVHVNINHDSQKRAVAWVKPGSMYVAKSNNYPNEYALYGQLYRFTDKGLDYIRQGVFRYFSIEIRFSFSTFVDNVKKTFKDVITGLALTNIPAVKGMSPTFNEEQENCNISFSTMKLKNMLEIFSAKSTMTKEEQSVFSELVSQFDEEEVAENKEAIDEIKAKDKPETPVATKGDTGDKTGDHESKDNDKTKNHSSVGATQSFSEAYPAEFAEMQKMQATIKEKQFEEQFSENLLLKEGKKAGFLESSKGKVKEFCFTLNDNQIIDFMDLFSEVTTADFKEYGSTGKNESKKYSSEDEIPDLDIQKCASEFMKEGLNEVEAMSKAIEKLSK